MTTFEKDEKIKELENKVKQLQEKADTYRAWLDYGLKCHPDLEALYSACLGNYIDSDPRSILGVEQDITDGRIKILWLRDENDEIIFAFRLKTKNYDLLRICGDDRVYDLGKGTAVRR